MAKISVNDILIPIKAIMEKVNRKEEITEEERIKLRAGMPVQFAYDELIRQVKKYEETINQDNE